jgi:hypothetical protein
MPALDCQAFDILKVSLMLASRAVKHARSIFLVDKKWFFSHAKCMSIVACSIRVNGMLLMGWLANVGKRTQRCFRDHWVVKTHWV